MIYHDLYRVPGFLWGSFGFVLRCFKWWIHAVLLLLELQDAGRCLKFEPRRVAIQVCDAKR